LADVALAGRVLASHYAETVARVAIASTPLRDAAHEGSQVIDELQAGEPFGVVEDSVGWAWGYAGIDRRVGYVRTDALSPKSSSGAR
jgi:hypothetical protein